MKKTVISRAILLALPLISLHSISYAAEIPANVKLAAKQELVKGNGAEVVSLDPHKSSGVYEHNVLIDLFETLIVTDPDGNIIPGAAESWESNDNKTWIFHLRKDAKWSNGDPVTAHDFVYAWQRLVAGDTGSPYASYFQYMKMENIDDVLSGKKKPEELGVSAVDDYTLKLSLSSPVAYLPNMMTLYALPPVHKKTIETYGDLWAKPGNLVSNGAFRLSEHVINEKIVLERNPHYWNNEKTVLEKVTFLPIVGATDESARYRAGEIDMTAQIPLDLYPKFKQEMPDEIKTSPSLCTYFYEPNNQIAPFNDPKVREALKLTIMQNVMAENVLGQGQLPAYGFTPSATKGGNFTAPEWFNQPQETRNERAKALLKEAGFNESNPLKFTLLYNTDEAYKKLAVAAAQMWKKNLGIEVTLENLEWKTYLDKRYSGDFQIAGGRWCGVYNEPSTFLNKLRSDPSNKNNTAFYKNPEYDAILDKALTISELDERQKLYQQAEDILDKDSGIIPIYYNAKLRLVKPYVGGFTAKEPIDSIRDKDLYIIEH